MMVHGLKTRIEELIAAAASETGYEIYEDTVYLKGENSKISVKIDRASGISHGDCETYSRELTRKLDHEELLPNYSLEVSSPGVRRKLRSKEDFARFKGSRAKVIYENETGRFAVIGIITDIHDESVFINSENREMEFPYTQIKSANLEL